jgi:para-nitrobenzyl esterase
MINRRRIVQSIGLGAAAATLRTRTWASLLPQAPPKTPTATVWGGEISGYRCGTNDRIAAFKGIPYGMDTRKTRSQAPKRIVGNWDNVLVCTEWAQRAPQQSPDRGRPNPVNQGLNALQDPPVHYHLPPDEGPQSEDCLHVNVWTPGMRDRKRRPVLFYIHGGAYNNGTVNAALYDGTRLAERGDVVVVTVNHRLNAFGYMYLAGLPGLAEHYAESGNVGQLDLVLALQWVRDNIEEFGGDKDRVAIFGQSGGGAKCATLMAMPAAKGLFHRVWTMSGQQVTAPSKAVSTDRAIAALAAMGLTGTITPEKLDALTMEQIQAGARTTGNWLPVKDDVVLKRQPFQPNSPPISDDVPMILGNTKDEIMGSTAWRLADLTWETLPTELQKAIVNFEGGYSVDQIIAAYRKWYPQYTPVDVYVASMAAFRSWPGQVIEAERRASSPDAAAHTWVYQIDYPSPTADGRAPHTIDIAFVFDNLELSPGMIGDTPADIAAAQPLATLMSQALIRFATTGDPNGGSLPKWPVYDLKDRETMLFDKVSKAVSDPRGDERRMMAGAHYHQPGT